MKKFLLIAGIVSVSAISQAQTYTMPNTYYDDVLEFDGGNYYDPAGTRGTVVDEGSIISTSQSDAYDGAFEIALDDSAFTYVPDGGFPADTDFVHNTITTGQQYIRGLMVSKELYFPTNYPIMRLRAILENTDTVAKTVRLTIATNLGSDSDTRLDSSSTGSNYVNGINLNNTDRWMITSDSYSDTLPSSDPVNTFVRFGPGTIMSQPMFQYAPEQGNDDYYDTMIVTVPAGSKAYVVMFNRLDSNVIAAKSAVSMFDNVAGMVSDSLFRGIDDLTKIVNWNFATPAPTVAASNMTFSNVTTTSFDVSWTNGNGARRIAVIKQDSAVTGFPMNGMSYTASPVFASGSELGYHNYDVYDGTGNTVSVTGLTPNTLYFVEVTEYNGTGVSTAYLTSPTLDGSQMTLPVATGINEAATQALSAQLMPNPNNGLVTVNYSQLTNLREIKIMNVVGKEVESIEVPAGNTSMQINTSKLNSGTYFMYFISTGQSPVVQKMVKY